MQMHAVAYGHELRGSAEADRCRPSLQAFKASKVAAEERKQRQTLL